MKDTELKRERDLQFYRTYLRGLREEHFETMHEAVDWCRFQPAPKFYLSSKSLVNYIAMLQCGIQLNSLHQSTRQKVKHLFRRYLEYRAEHPECKDYSRERICEIIVDEPAPQFYIGHEMGLKILQEQRRNRWKSNHHTAVTGVHILRCT